MMEKPTLDPSLEFDMPDWKYETDDIDWYQAPFSAFCFFSMSTNCCFAPILTKFSTYQTTVLV